MTTRTLSTDARLTALEDCENKIRTAFRRGLDATCAIAKELIKINRDQLFEAAGHKTMDSYRIERLRMDDRTCQRIIKISQTVEQFKQSGLELPANETQVLELTRLEAPQRVQVWHELLIKSEKSEQGLTVEDIRRAVDDYKLPPGPAPAAGTVEVAMEDDSNGNEPSKPQAEAEVKEAELLLTEKGEAALNRIRKICGDMVANAIEDGTKAMTEREMKAWAEHDDEMMRGLSYYLIDRNWTLSKAVNFASRGIQESTDVRDLILIANSRGGKATLPVDGQPVKITVEILH